MPGTKGIVMIGTQAESMDPPVIRDVPTIPRKPLDDKYMARRPRVLERTKPRKAKRVAKRKSSRGKAYR